MKAVLLPIQPRHCEYIARDEERICVRKTKPALEPPFKCYIYETSNQQFENTWLYWGDIKRYFTHWIGRVIGEFVCDKIYEIYTYRESSLSICIADSNEVGESGVDIENLTCLPKEEIIDYLIDSPKCFGYGWHISALKFYDKPKELGAFTVAQHEYRGKRVMRSYGGWKVKRVANWCYVEEL